MEFQLSILISFNSYLVILNFFSKAFDDLNNLYFLNFINILSFSTFTTFAIPYTNEYISRFNLSQSSLSPQLGYLSLISYLNRWILFNNYSFSLCHIYFNSHDLLSFHIHHTFRMLFYRYHTSFHIFFSRSLT